jgi:thymidine kinase
MVVQLIIGPMYAGKTTKLFETYNFYGGLIIDFCEGEPNRGTVKNHKDEKKECIRTPRLSYLSRPEFIADLTEHVNIYINEAQFFPDLLEFIDNFESTKEIRIYGLDGDYRRKPFGQILDIIPYCDTIEKLRGVCVCGKRSIHSKRVTDYKGQFLLDENAYVPACRICYIL